MKEKKIFGIYCYINIFVITFNPAAFILCNHFLNAGILIFSHDRSRKDKETMLEVNFIYHNRYDMDV